MKIMKVIIPSIIAKTQKELEQRIERVQGFAKTIQLDIMDGKFIKQKSLDFNFVLPKLKCEVEAHLMISDPLKWLENHCEFFNRIIFNVESTDDPLKCIELAKLYGKKVGLALNPETPLTLITDFIRDIDQITIMTVQPGKYGAKFIPDMLQKIRDLRKVHPYIDIEVDGGITPQNINDACAAGANRIVSGSYIQNARDPKKAFKELKGEVKLNLISQWTRKLNISK